MLAPDLSPVHFWKHDLDSIEIKLNELHELQLTEYVSHADDADTDIEILSLSPIKNRAVLSLMRSFKKSRGVPQSAASTRRKMQSLKIAKALDDLTCITETPTRLSICRGRSICNVPSPVSPQRQLKTPEAMMPDPEMKYLFEVLGASTPFMLTPPLSTQKKSESIVHLCSMDEEDIRTLSMNLALIDRQQNFASVARSKESGIPTPSRSATKRSVSAPPKRSPVTPATPATKAYVFGSRAAIPGIGQTQPSQCGVDSNQSPHLTYRKKSGSRSPRFTNKNPSEQASPIRTAKRAQFPAERTPRLVKPTCAETESGKKNTPSYLRPTQNSMASSRSPSPAAIRNISKKFSPSPSRPRLGNDPVRRSPGYSPLEKAAGRNAVQKSPKNDGTTTPVKYLQSHLEDENISPNVTSRSSHEFICKNTSTILEVKNITPRMSQKTETHCEKDFVPGVVAARETENDFFNSVMASCDDILAQLDAAVSKGPRILIK